MVKGKQDAFFSILLGRPVLVQLGVDALESADQFAAAGLVAIVGDRARPLLLLDAGEVGKQTIALRAEGLATRRFGRSRPSRPRARPDAGAEDHRCEGQRQIARPERMVREAGHLDGQHAAGSESRALAQDVGVSLRLDLAMLRELRRVLRTPETGDQ